MNVRQAGANFLATTPKPTNAQFKNGKEYWKLVSHDLYEAYQRICAYSCTPIWYKNTATVDHYLPKSSSPALTYEWSNYRLARHKLNTYKGANLNVLDPFLVNDEWFHVDFPSCLLKPGINLTQAISEQIEETIRCLKLNDDDELVQERADRMIDFANQLTDLNYLKKYYPLLAKEIIRQGIENSANEIFKSRGQA
jgi:hypothetical protein